MGRAVIIPEHINRLLAAADEGEQACVREPSAIVLAYLFGERPVSTAAICANRHHHDWHRDRHADQDQDQDQSGNASTPLRGSR